MKILPFHKAIVLFAAVLFFSITNSVSLAQTIASVSGNWSSPATWGGAAIPTSADAAIINSGVTVTVDVNDAACASLQINEGTSAAAVIQFNSASQLTVSGSVTLGNSINNGAGSIIMTNGGLLSCNALVNGGGTGTKTWTPGNPGGTVQLNATNTLPSQFATFYNLIIGGATTLGANTTINGTLTLVSGVLTSTSTNMLRALATTTISGGSVSSYISGPLRWTLPSGTSTYTFPVGKGGVFLPIVINPTSSTTPRLVVEAFSANSGGSAGAGTSSISNTEYWSVNLNSGTYNNGRVSITRQSALGVFNAIGMSTPAANGSYTNMNGTVSGTSVNTSDLVGAITATNYFVFAQINLATPTFTIANPTTAVGAASICPSTVKVPIHAFNITSSANSGILTNFQFNTSGTYVGSDITNFKIWYNTTNNIASATSLATLTNPGGPGLKTFSAFSVTIPSGSTYYFWITADVTASVANGDLLTVSGSNAADMTTTATKAGGPTNASGTQTLNALPTVVTVSGGGSFCGSTTLLTASGGTGGTIYWQNTTTNGTSTATPSSSQTVSANGTYYFRASNGSCWGTQGSATVTLGTGPAISPGASPQVCQGAGTANLSYSAATGSPNQYTVNFDGTAQAQGFVDVINGVLPASPIVLTVPPGVAAGTYNFNLSVRNSSTSCVSSIYVLTINVSPSTGVAGPISGLTSVAPTSSGFVYSIAVVPGASGYTWTVPTGWAITSGAGTTSITVNSGAIGQDGNISVTPIIACGTGTPSTIAIVIAGPHSSCNSCHINHTSPGVSLTSILGNANLCMNCHTPSGVAGTMPFTDAMKAVPGVSGSSHNWTADAVNPMYQTSLPTDPGMQTRVYNGQIVCSTCHNQHPSNTIPHFLRIANTDDALCLSCHSARNIGRYADNPANKGTHPVGITYSLADTRFQAMSLPLTASNQIFCSSCHDTHNAVSSDGNILRTANSDALCATCHTTAGYNTTLNHKGMSCTTCHYAHNTGSNNIYLINDNITTPNSGTKATVFTNNSTGSSYADATGIYNGVCEVCHTTTDHYSNTSMGTTDARHMISPATKCTTCHPHNTGFAAQTDCFSCHNIIADKPGVGPAGGVRQIVDGSGNGLGTGGDFKRTSHHVSGSIPTVADCLKCHYMGDHKTGVVKLLDPDLGYQNIITYDPLNKSSIESFCLKCHDANGANGNTTPFSDNVTVPVVDATAWAASSHKGNANSGTCLVCHDNGHGSNKSNLLAPATYTGTGTGTDLMNEEEGFCINCHGAAGLATVKVHLAFSSYTNTTTNFYKHDPNATYRKHNYNEAAGSAFGGTNRHIECVDCHNPHAAVAGTATAPVLLPTLIGASGVEPVYGASNTSPGAPTGFTWMPSVTQEYQVCMKCHSSFTTLPTYLPGGYQNGALVADGLKKLTTGGTNSQIADSRDMAQEYNPNNQSYHPVMAAGKNLNINATAFQAGYTYTSRIYCSDCHSNSSSATAGHGNGPHGSANLHILDAGPTAAVQYDSYNSSNSNTNEICNKCHTTAGYYTGNTGSRFSYHNYHTTKTDCYTCHDSHGSEQFHLFNFSRNETGNISAFGTAPNNTSQSGFVHVAGTATNTCFVTCHGTSHGAGKSYNPSYN
ncbi:MAG: cytochrome c3 family protein [Bacteroidota bacterium]